jgi:hypothetical protein
MAAVEENRSQSSHKEDEYTRRHVTDNKWVDFYSLHSEPEFLCVSRSNIMDISDVLSLKTPHPSHEPCRKPPPQPRPGQDVR